MTKVQNRKIETRIRYSVIGVLMGFGLLGHAKVNAETIDAQRVYNLALANTCASCHGTNGVSVPGAGVPVINDLTAEQIAESMRGYKDGGREGTIMHQLAKGYTDEQIEIIAQVLGKK